MNAYTRATTLIRGHAAACAHKNLIVKCPPPRSVKFIHIDEHDDKWGTTPKCLYHLDESGKCSRFPGAYDVLISFEVIRRTQHTFRPELVGRNEYHIT